tara:strand:+ start:2809 stop:3174 length:366 start_codon:yes stop_codon:yes gene_type:complete
MIETLDRGTRKARKPHQCYDCYRMIAPGEVYEFGTFKYDDVYTLKHHPDCMAASAHYIKFHGTYYDHYEGIQPLADMISDGGEFKLDHAMLRGHFPHVVCRLELSDQLSEIRREKRQLENA